MGSASVAQSHRSLKVWHLAIDLIKQLHLLSSDVRAHRGVSTALLGGDHFFAPITKRYDENVRLHFASIAQDKASLSILDSEEEFADIYAKWRAIETNWKRHPQLTNFYNHCELLKEIQLMIWRLAISADKNLMDNSDKALIARFILKHHAVALEAIARLRGYACAFCAQDEISEEEQRLIGDEIKEVFASWQKRQDAFNTLPYEFYKKLQAIESQPSLTEHMLEFINLVSPMQHAGASSPNGSEVFNLANKTLSILNLQYLEGLDSLRNMMPEELLDWIQTPARGELKLV